ncbi:MAG: hypothetical protein HPY50_10690 [Firmicutes bacterium]|nr:hypothetical protein [Bacillota bacterium]
MIVSPALGVTINGKRNELKQFTGDVMVIIINEIIGNIIADNQPKESYSILEWLSINIHEGLNS